MRIPGIYVDIKGDVTQLDADMRKARAIVRESATGMSNALNNALSPNQVKNGVNGLVRNLGTLKRSAELTGDEFNSISVDLGKLSKHLGLSEKEFGKLQQRMLQTRASHQADRAIRSIARSADLSAREMAMLRLKFGDAEGAMSDFKRAGVSSINAVRDRIFSLQTAFATAGLGMGLHYSVQAFADMDRGLIAVQKTTDLTDSEIQQLGKDIQQITTELPLTSQELLSIAQSAGQLGVQGSSNILKFTRTVGMLGTASDLHGEEAATTLARLMNVTSESADQVDILGSVIVALGNDMATTESEVALMATEVGQATSQFHVSSAEAAALGATLRSLGVRAELGGSAIGRVFRSIDASIRGGGDSLERLEKLTGETASHLRKTFSEDATSVFRLFIEGLGNVIKSGGSATDALEGFGLKGEEILKVVPTLALRSEKLGRALGIAAAEQKNATALTEEALKAASSFSAQMTIVSNEVDVAAAAIGEELAPYVLEAAQAFGDFAESNAGEFADWVSDAASGAKELSPLIGAVRDEAGYLFNAFTDLPVELQAAGLIPALLFGKKGVAAALAALHLGEAIVNTGQGLAAVNLGHMSWDEFLSLDAEELQEKLEALKKNKNNIKRLQSVKEKDAQIMSQGGRFYVGNTGIFGEDLASLAESPFVGPRRPVNNEPTRTPDVADSSEELDKKRLSARKNFNTAYSKLALEPYEFERRQIQEQRAVWEKAGVSHVQLAKWETMAITELDEKFQEKKQRDLRNFNTAYNKAFLDPYILERKAIEEQARVWKEDGADKIKVNQWVASELAKQDREYSAKAKAEAKKRAEEANREARERLEASDDFFQGMKAGFRDVYEEQETFAERGIDIAHDFATSSKAAFSDFGVDLMKGQLDDFSSYYETFLSGLRRSLADHMADLVVNKGMGMLVQYAGSMFDYGSAATDFLGNIFHTGNIRLGADEVAAILQEKEMVIPAKQAEVIRQAVGSDGMSKGHFFDSVVDYVSVGKQRSFDSYNNAQSGDFAHDILQVTGTSLLAGLTNAYSNYSAIGNHVNALRNAGVDVSQPAVDNAKYNYALSGLLGSFSQTFTGDLLGAWGIRALGLNDNAFDIGGLEFSSSSIGNLLAQGVGMFLGGPVGSVVSGVLSPAFSLGVSGLADAFGLREYETIRDKLEEDLGFIGGRIAYQTFQGAFSPSAVEPDKFTWGFGLQTFSKDQIAQMMIKKMEAFSEIGEMTSSVEKALATAHNLGHAYTSAMMASDDPTKQASIAGAIKNDLGFFGYTAREFAAKQLGGYEYGDSYYTPFGKRVDINSIENPNSAAYAAAQAADRFGRAGNYSTGDNIGGSGYDWSGNGGSWSADRDTSGAGSHDTGGMGNEASGGKSGYGGTSNQGGYTGGRRYGGSVEAHKPYLWQENVPGLSGEIFMPKTDGYVMKHEDTRDFINALNAVVAQQKDGGKGGSAPGGNLVVKLVVGEQEIAQAVIPGIHEASKNGVRIIHADTLIEGRS